MGYVGLSVRGEEVIRTIIAERCSPLKEEIKKHSIQITNGILLCGPPGTGKTLLVRHLSSLMNCETENIHLLSGSKICNKWKKTGVNIEKIFMKILKSAQAPISQNTTFLLVIDEIDVIFSQCSNKSNTLCINTIVDEFHTQMNVLRNVYNILVVGVTNHFEKIDEAVIRLGLFDKCIEFTVPDFQARKELLHLCTFPLVKQGLLDTDIDFDAIAQESKGLSGADISAFVKQAITITMNRMFESGDKTLLTMNDLWQALNEMKKLH